MDEREYWLPDGAYQALKWLAALVLPAASTLTVTLGNVWGWPEATPVAATLTAIGTFLGAVMVTSAATGRPAAGAGGGDAHGQDD